jgi:hypothetical protein
VDRSGTQNRAWNTLAPLPQAPSLEPELVLPASWDYGSLGLFCKLDVQFERHLPLPVLFRLGDVQRVEAWEGKGPLRNW